ncbi:MAG: GIY-YIG nuclease family protein [Planctomycetota bacterium]
MFASCLIATLARGESLEPPRSDDQIRAAFRTTHQGFSSDELLVRDDLFNDFMVALGWDGTSPDKLMARARSAKRLLTLRKTGKLGVVSTKRSQTPELADTIIAEMAIRTLLNRHRCSIDDVLCAPHLRDQLQSEALKLDPTANADAVRKSVLKLRKVRQLRPELVLQVADWDREVRTIAYSTIDSMSLPAKPGVYLFRCPDGYLYIGEASNLADRLRQHVAGSHNSALASALEHQGGDITVELHVFPRSSPASRVSVRRAYESELIRSRHPTFNLRP